VSKLKIHGMEVAEFPDDDGKKDDVGVLTYKDITHQLGRAEFAVCYPIAFAKDKSVIKEVYISPRQQPDTANKAYLVKHHGATEITLAGLGVAEPRVWRTGACSEIGGAFMDIYVPTGSSLLKVSRYSTSLDLVFR